MTTPDATPANGLAARLLDAHVDFAVAELTDRFGEVVAASVDEVLAAAETITVAQVVDVDAASRLVRRIVGEIADSAVVEDLASVFADAIYDLEANDRHRLGDVVAREPVEALVAAALAMHGVQDRVLDRLADSPLVGAVATRFVTTVVGEVIAQNRQLAEKLPGVASLFSLGQNAASRVRGVTDPLLGDVAGRGAGYAIRRTNSAVRETMRDAPVQDAAMEVWDLQAAEMVGELRDYVGVDEVRELLRLLLDVLATARRSEYAGEVIDACVAAFVERYADYDLAALLDELGVTRDGLVEDVTRLASPALAAARETGALASVVRGRLAPFYASDAAAAVLAER